MTALIYALMFTLSGGIANNVNNSSNSNKPQFVQTQITNYTYSVDSVGDDDDDDARINPYEL